MSYCTWDIESTIVSAYKRKATPFISDNWVVTHGFKHKGELVKEVRFGADRPPSGWLRDVLYNSKGERISLLITMNGKFDLLHALQDSENLELWMDYVASGGRLYCVQLAEYLLCGQAQESQMLSLDEIAPRYGGNLKVDEVKLLWEAGVNTPDIEPELLTRYLCGGLDENGQYQMGDVENTEKVALAQIARARANGQLNSILLNMGALLFTVEAERNGMWVDTVDGMRLTEGLRIQLAELTEVLHAFIPDAPFEFNWNSRFHKSALIFGGTVEYAAYQYDTAEGGTIWKRDYDMLPVSERPTLLYAQKEEVHYVLANGGTMECEKYHWMEDNRPDAGNPPHRDYYASGKREGEYKTKKVKVNDLTKPKGRMVDTAGERPTFTFPGYTVPEKKWEGADKGVYSTASEVIEELALVADGVPFLKAFTGLTKVAKDLGTYFMSVDEKTGERKGMLTLVGEDGLIHHMLNMVSTITARLSSANPNL